jgi:diguanylate cyclase (GGDEF)-like protein/PAS domain S-box-containing protein
MGDTDFYKTLLDYIDEGVYFVDLEGRITFWNKAAEKISGYSEQEAVGKRCSEKIWMHVSDHEPGLCLTSCPLKKSNIDGISPTANGYLHHKEGFLLPVAVRVALLKNDNGEISGGVEFFSDNSSKIAAFQRMLELKGPACMDPLTEVAGKKYLEIFIQSSLDELQRYEWPFGILSIDLDHLKACNYYHGHEIGDRLLKMVAMTLAKNARSFDAIGRWGGQEFIFVIFNTNPAHLFDISERYRKLIACSKLIVNDKAISVTVSIGATIARKNDSFESIMQRADKAMLKSKSSGRNCVTIE